MNIFLANNLPCKNFAGEVYWLPKQTWAVTIDGLTYYGARSKQDLEKAMAPQKHQYVKKSINYVFYEGPGR